MRDDELDALLSAPPASIADDGFAERVVNRIARPQIELAMGALLAAVAAIVLLVLPVDRIAAPVVDLALAMAWSFPLAVCCAALLLTHMAARLLAD